MGTRFLLLISLIFLVFYTSCTSSHNIPYFQNNSNANSINNQQPIYNQQLESIEAPFQKNDILDITISSRSKEASADFNKPELVVEGPKGYLINSEGNIELPMLGNIKAEGLTKKQLKDNITKTILAKGLLIEPMVEIRHLNFEITVLGEVAAPKVINVPSEQITLVKALALAGDLTIYGKRENILLVRDEDGVRKTSRINLNSSDFLNSEYYYLKPNDLIYVEPNRTKIAANSRSVQVMPYVITSISFLIIILDRVLK